MRIEAYRIKREIVLMIVIFHYIDRMIEPHRLADHQIVRLITLWMGVMVVGVGSEQERYQAEY